LSRIVHSGYQASIRWMPTGIGKTHSVNPSLWCTTSLCGIPRDGMENPDMQNYW
jgi:hypothetical protein